MSSPEPHPGGGAERLLHGRYRLVRPLARGGMAQVWEGHDDVLARSVAVKLLHDHLAADPDVRERFRREAIAAARLAHPNVVAIFDTGIEDDRPFIVMELVTGRTLRDRLDEGPLSAGLAAAITDQAAQALAHAHAAGLIHRDVKPGNILLIDQGQVPHVKVTDFGIARATVEDARLTDGTDLTDPGTVMGTMKYIAPEVVEGHPADACSDVYALGVVLFEMLTGRPPFEASTPLATAIARLNDDPPRPRQLRAGIPRALEAVTMKALARDPADRYASAEELRTAVLAADLGPDDALPLVHPDPTPPRGAPPGFGRSERTWIVPTVLIVVAAAIVIAAGVLFASSDTGRDLLGSRSPGGGGVSSLPVVSVRSFDPQGDGQENPAQVGAVIDPDPATTWSSDRYEAPARLFGNLKDGLGLIFELGGDEAITDMSVSSPSRGWSAEVYVADQAATALGGWGPAVDTQADVDGDATFDLGGARGRYVLLWFTRLPVDGRVEVGDVQLRG